MSSPKLGLGVVECGDDWGEMLDGRPARAERKRAGAEKRPCFCLRLKERGSSRLPRMGSWANMSASVSLWVFVLFGSKSPSSSSMNKSSSSSRSSESCGRILVGIGLWLWFGFGLEERDEDDEEALALLPKGPAMMVCWQHTYPRRITLVAPSHVGASPSQELNLWEVEAIWTVSTEAVGRYLTAVSSVAEGKRPEYKAGQVGFEQATCSPWSCAAKVWRRYRKVHVRHSLGGSNFFTPLSMAFTNNTITLSWWSQPY